MHLPIKFDIDIGFVKQFLPFPENSLEILNGGLLIDLPINLVSDRELCQKKGRLSER